MSGVTSGASAGGLAEAVGAGGEWGVGAPFEEAHRAGAVGDMREREGGAGSAGGGDERGRVGFAGDGEIGGDGDTGSEAVEQRLRRGKRDRVGGDEGVAGGAGMGADRLFVGEGHRPLIAVLPRRGGPRVMERIACRPELPPSREHGSGAGLAPA